MDELRGEVWDFLFRAEGPQHVDAIARHVGRHAEAIHSVLDHEWFDVVGDLVAIAYRHGELQMDRGSCPNFNHRKTNPPVRFCPNCGKMVNENIAIKQCSEQAHAKARLDRNKYCVDCGEQLIK